MSLNVPCYHRDLMMRFAAIALLVLMCVDIGLDLWHGETGDVISDGATFSTAPVTQTASLVSEQGPQSGSEDSHHDCFCCCSHVEQGSAEIVSVILNSSPSFFTRSVCPGESDLRPIYHPPQFTT